MGKASNQKKKRRQGTGASRADLEGQRALEQLARAAQKLNSMFEARKEHLAAVNRSWWRGAEPEAAEVPSWAEGSAGDAETMRQLGGKSEGNPLDFLISEKAIEPADVLTIGLAVLATLADLCRTAEASVRVPC